MNVAMRRVQAAAARRRFGIGMKKVEFQCSLQMLHGSAVGFYNLLQIYNKVFLGARPVPKKS
jgi:hypothetical protein